jgi:hypothetical protein
LRVRIVPRVFLKYGIISSNAKGKQMTPKEQIKLYTESLHKLIADGKGDSPDADAIRERMEDPWYKMTADEQKEMDEYSVELYAKAEEKTHRDQYKALLERLAVIQTQKETLEREENEVANAMDTHWHKMSEEEQKEMRKYSAELYAKE